ncbi:MAG: sigma 54-interacting transcriptional regulator [Ignavibacteriaceae bacterium]|jgi:transcriptional regulator with PAS, ATPase and Fis domain|nr:sigma 54-interacting transcriptional regulator [Ignavibacteriaceae bacterium]
MASANYSSLENLSENKVFLQTILDLSIKGLMVIDCEGKIIFINKSFEEIHNVSHDEVIGKHVTEIIENTRMHLVAKTGIPEKDVVQHIHGHEYVVSRLPILENGKCLGVIGLIRFEYTDELKNAYKQVEKLQIELQNSKSRSKMNPYTNFTFDDIVAISNSSLQIKQTALRAAASDSTVLLLGETGVGKEVYAHSIHNLSKRNKGPFIRLNCSAIQETLFESELFGYEEGAFTGAKKGGKKGKFELADTGTIFLDEIGDMPLNVQSRLLRVLQESEIDKLGSEALIKVDVRLIAATNENLEELVNQGKFRSDLFYRLNVIPITIPPLRDRQLDIPAFIKIMWKKLSIKHGIYHKKISYEALRTLEAYNWPGNVRELNNVLERVMAIVPHDIVTEEHIRTIIQGNQTKKEGYCMTNNCTLNELLYNTEKEAISFALVRSSNNRTLAAKLLGISRALLYKRMHEYNLI